MLLADLYEFAKTLRIPARGRVLACYVIAAKAGGAVEVRVDDRRIGRCSTQSQPDRLLKPVVLWDRASDDVAVAARVEVSRCMRAERPKVQNLFSWHDGPDSEKRDALIGVLVES